MTKSAVGRGTLLPRAPEECPGLRQQLPGTPLRQFRDAARVCGNRLGDQAERDERLAVPPRDARAEDVRGAHGLASQCGNLRRQVRPAEQLRIQRWNLADPVTLLRDRFRTGV